MALPFAHLTSASQAAEPLHAIAGFAALLRDHGFTVGIAEQQAFISAALAVSPDRPQRTRAAWRAIACHSARDWRQWDDVFDRYWHPDRVRGSTKVSGQMRPGRDLRQVVEALQSELAQRPSTQPHTQGLSGASDSPDRADDAQPAPERAQGGATRTEALQDRRFQEWLPQDLSQLNDLAERIAARLRRRVTRRWHRREGGLRLDLRQTLRASLATGGLPLRPVWAERQREQPRLFILVDVSRSMETHAQLFLRIARAFVHAAQARVFVFHTRLAEVTPLLQRDSAAVQEKVNAVTAGFGGGTRIATSLNDFIQVHARSQLGRSTRLWIFSDGFDADPLQELSESVAKLCQRGGQITWFHPGDQAPAGEAMQTLCLSMPHAVRRFVRLNRLSDLQAAAAWLH